MAYVHIPDPNPNHLSGLDMDTASPTGTILSSVSQMMLLGAHQKLPFQVLSGSISSQAVRSFLSCLYHTIDDIGLLVKYVPEWVPGAGFKKQAREWRKLATGMVDLPFNMVKERMVLDFRCIVKFLAAH